MRRTLIVLIVVPTLLGLGCGTTDSDGDDGASDDYAPAVSSVIWFLHDTSSQCYENPQATAWISFKVGLENPSRQPDVTSLSITDPLGTVWSWDSQELTERWDSGCEYYGLWYCSRPEDPDAIGLGEYMITIEQEGRLPSTYSFTVIGRSDTSLTSGRVYSYASPGTPKILRPPYDCSCLADGQTLIARFSAQDSLIDNGFLWLDFRIEDSTDYAVSSRLGDLGALNPQGSNEFQLDISDVPGEIFRATIALTAYAPGNRGFYWAHSDSIHVARRLDLGTGVERRRLGTGSHKRCNAPPFQPGPK
jgi:hypothetical protein